MNSLFPLFITNTAAVSLQLCIMYRLRFFSVTPQVASSADVAAFLWQMRIDNEARLTMRPPIRVFHLEPSSGNAFGMQDEVQALTEVAKSAAHELFILSDSSSPLWLAVPGGSFQVLNRMAYAQMFPGQMGVGTIGLTAEATRASAVVMLDPKSIVEFLMDSVSGMSILIEAS
jgi:hypothetical protein